MPTFAGAKGDHPRDTGGESASVREPLPTGTEQKQGGLSVSPLMRRRLAGLRDGELIPLGLLAHYSPHNQASE